MVSVGPRSAGADLHHIAGDAVLLQHHGDGLGGVVDRVPLAATLGVGDERLFELIGETKVIHHQPAGLSRSRARRRVRDRQCAALGEARLSGGSEEVNTRFARAMA